MNTELRYKTFDELLNEVASDFRAYNNEGMIEPGQLIKVAQRVSYDLGLKIHGTKEKLIEIEYSKTKLPDDFYTLNYAMLCRSYRVETPVLQGRQTENVVLNKKNVYLNGELCNKCGYEQQECGCESTYSVQCETGEKIFVQVVEKRKTETRVYEEFERVYISADTGKLDALDRVGSYDEHQPQQKTAYIKNGFIYTNFPQGKLFISYQGALEDDNGNLLVLDHPMINEYYEYALKQRILENLYIEGEDVVQRLQLIETKLKQARNYALSIVNTPNFSEMYQLWQMNRKAQYSKYYDMFKSGEVQTLVLPKK
jgi:hypothetical protein